MSLSNIIFDTKIKYLYASMSRSLRMLQKKPSEQPFNEPRMTIGVGGSMRMVLPKPPPQPKPKVVPTILDIYKEKLERIHEKRRQRDEEIRCIRERYAQHLQS